MKIITALSNKLPDKAGKYVIQSLAAFSAFLLMMNSGMLHGWPSPSLPQLLINNQTNCTICMTSSEGAWMASTNMVGSLVGALIGAVVGHHMGRKTILIISGPPFFVCWIMIAFADNSLLLFLARFIAGVADGLVYTVGPMYVGEISSPSIRGSLGSGISTSWIFGILLMNVIGSYTSMYVTALISCIFPILATVFMVFMPESPYYLLSKGRVDKARRSLQVFNGTNDVEHDLNRISSAVSANTKNRGHYLELFTKKVNRKALWVVFVLRTIQQLSGTTAFIFFAQNIFSESGGGSVSSKEASIIYFGVQFIVIMISSGVVDKTGRRPLLFLSIAGSAVALFVEGTFFYLKEQTDIDTEQFSYVPLAALVIFVVFFSFGLQGMPILMLGEIFAADVKAFALGIADAYYSILATVVSKFFQITKDTYGMYVPFYSFAICCVCGLVLTIIITPETKGKTLEEIQELLEGKRKNNKEDVTNESTKV